MGGGGPELAATLGDGPKLVATFEFEKCSKGCLAVKFPRRGNFLPSRGLHRGLGVLCRCFGTNSFSLHVCACATATKTSTKKQTHPNAPFSLRVMLSNGDEKIDQEADIQENHTAHVAEADSERQHLAAGTAPPQGACQLDLTFPDLSSSPFLSMFLGKSQ